MAVVCSLFISCSPTKKFVRTSWLYYREKDIVISSHGQAIIGQRFEINDKISSEIYAGEYYGSISGETYSLIGSGIDFYPMESLSLGISSDVLINNENENKEFVLYGGGEYEW